MMTITVLVYVYNKVLKPFWDMSNLSFEYEQAYDNYLQSNVERWIIINMVDSDYEGGELYVRVGKGY